MLFSHRHRWELPGAYSMLNYIITVYYQTKTPFQMDSMEFPESFQIPFALVLFPVLFPPYFPIHGRPPFLRHGAKLGGYLESMTETRLSYTRVGPIGDPPYPGCPICFSPIRPAQPSWSCSPSSPTLIGESSIAGRRSR